jgi:hypothetical protein
MVKKKKDNQVACVDKTRVLAKVEDNQRKTVVKTLNDEEKEKRIEGLKINTDRKKYAETKKRIAEIQKEADEKGIVLSDRNDVFVPLNDEEKKMVSEWRERLKKTPQNPIVFTYTLGDDGKETGSIETIDSHPVSPKDKWEIWNTAINLATGSASHEFGYRLFNLCLVASGFDKPAKNKGADYTGVLNAMQALKPQDEIEGMLISRLISLHNQSMRYFGCTNLEGQTTQGIDTNINRSTKLARLYNETLEALSKYRRGGEQRVVVQHVNVENGGKAIVGNMIAGGGGQ